MIDRTHDPALRSWVESANESGCDFPIQNLPFAAFRRGTGTHLGVAIGDQVLDVTETLQIPSMRSLMAMAKAERVALRQRISQLLAETPAAAAHLLPMAEVELLLPCEIGDYTDFYASIHHATNVGSMFRPDNPLLPNYKWLPIGYHGRSSSIGVSGQEFHRPWGQRLPAGQSEPVVEPSARLDYELELGVFLGPGNPLGTPITIENAEAHVFGLCLLNDWSARDIQAWEYQPLGPFLAKNFATTISPWIVSLQALAPFRAPHARGSGDPSVPAYLASSTNEAAGGFDIRLEVDLDTASMRDRGDPPQRLSSTSFRHSYWTVAQLIAHHTLNGCNLRAGDLLGTGTQSGPTSGEAGSMLELSGGGKQPVELGSGERRAFLEDGDAVTLRGWCEKAGAARIGFGESRGLILPAR
jgi:fumarylacetoacetase